MDNTAMDTSTFLFGEIIFGPVESRRLGKSLGINLLPTSCKLCNFNCLYCECGWTTADIKDHKLPTRLQVNEALTDKLARMVKNNHNPDYITFAGNGEPTIHPEFPEIVKDTINLRDQLTPQSKIAVLSNASMLHQLKIAEALEKVDQNIQKLDSAIDKTFQLINKPKGKIDVQDVINHLKQFKKLTIQSLFLKGTYGNEIIDNTAPHEVTAWLKAIKEIQPREIMIYTISRSTPHPSLKPIEKQELERIAEYARKEGFTVSVSA